MWEAEAEGGGGGLWTVEAYTKMRDWICIAPQLFTSQSIHHLFQSIHHPFQSIHHPIFFFFVAVVTFIRPHFFSCCLSIPLTWLEYYYEYCSHYTWSILSFLVTVERSLENEALFESYLKSNIIFIQLFDLSFRFYSQVLISLWYINLILTIIVKLDQLLNC